MKEMKSPKKDMSAWKNTKLLFLDHTHEMVGVMAAAVSGPMIDVDVKLLQLDDTSGVALPSIKPTASAELDNYDLVVYKHNARFFVLLGANQAHCAVAEGLATVKAKLVSGPMLKGTRVVVKIEPAEPVNTQMAAAFDKPYFHDKTKSGYQGKRYNPNHFVSK